ncbi:MAG: tyrosine-type recombinase/integrase [Acidobacteriota bacterium]
MGVKVKEKVRGSGVWWIFIHHKGERLSKCVGTEKAANKAADQIQARLALNLPPIEEEEEPKPKVESVDEYYKRFKRVYLDVAVRETTLEIYATAFDKHILPKLGEKGLDDVTRADIEDLVADLVKKLAKPTIRMTLSCLRAMFGHALEHEVISRNPVVKTTKMYANAPTKHQEIEPLTKTEVPLFLKVSKDLDAQAVARRKDSVTYYPLFLTAIHTGLREGELAGVKWSDFDFNGKFVAVRRNFVRGELVDYTKTKKQRRVDLSDAVITALKAHKGKVQQDWLKKGFNEIPEWVFANEKRKPLDMCNAVRRGFHKALDKAGLRRIRFHDLSNVASRVMF